VLRLLPERLYAGLFGQEAWLAQGLKGEPLAAQVPVPANCSPADVLDALLQSAPTRRRSGKLSVMLPSHSARCVSLPWSPHLRGDDERGAYALAHLEQAGLGEGESQVVHAEFRHYGARGLAYAVKTPLLDELHAVAALHGFDLTTVLPIGGVAHLAARRARGTGIEVSLVAEDASTSALVMDRAGLRRYDAEPNVGGRGGALRRLLTRLAADGLEIKGISLCAEGNDEDLARIAAGFALQVTVQRMKTSQWRRYL